MIPITPMRGVWWGSIWWSVSAHNWNVKSAPFRLLDSAQMSETVDTARQDLLRTVAAGTAGVVGEEFLQRLVQAVGETFGGGVCWISELSDSGQTARSLASWPPEALPAGREYKLDGTPCQLLHERTVVSYESGVPAAFPEDPFLIEHGLDGYLAVTCPRGDGRPIGYLAVTTQEALDARPDELAALQIFAARIGAELERRKQESRLREREAALIASRAKVLEAADEERKRIGRDLHDGAQQRLIALSLELSLLEQRLGGDPEATTRLDQARREIALSLEELRDVARGIHPAVLSGHGLEVALESIAAHASVPVRLTVELEERLQERLEVVAYYVVSESLVNIAKHARATRATVDVGREHGQMVVEVVDDGIGGADTERGSGLRGLADRVEALDGRLRVWTPHGGGTRVKAEIPCA